MDLLIIFEANTDTEVVDRVMSPRQPVQRAGLVPIAVRHCLHVVETELPLLAPKIANNIFEAQQALLGVYFERTTPQSKRGSVLSIRSCLCLPPTPSPWVSTHWDACWRGLPAAKMPSSALRAPSPEREKGDVSAVWVRGRCVCAKHPRNFLLPAGEKVAKGRMRAHPRCVDTNAPSPRSPAPIADEFPRLTGRSTKA